MKKLLIITTIATLAFGSITRAQTAIETKTVSSVSSVLEFATGTTKGIILPAVTTLPAAPANGTFLFDKTDKIVKMRQNGIWVLLSGVGNDTTVPYSGTTQDNTKQTVMGARTTAVDGVLVLEAPNKALVLPKVADPHLNVKSPYPGMVCYDTTKKALAVFDGKLWNYWK